MVSHLPPETGMVSEPRVITPRGRERIAAIIPIYTTGPGSSSGLRCSVYESTYVITIFFLLFFFFFFNCLILFLLVYPIGI